MSCSAARAVVVVAVSAALAPSCSRPIQTARLERLAPAKPQEVKAHHQVRDRKCSLMFAFLFPGAGQLCLGQTELGGTLMALGAVELGAGIAVAVRTTDDDPGGIEHPGAALPLIALQDLWVYGLAATNMTLHRARTLRYTPLDSPTDLLLAPFNFEVMKRPQVWLGTLGVLALGLGVTYALSRGDGTFDLDNVGDRANLFGREFSPAAGYPLAVGTGAALFTHVAIAEEAAFRGWIQSSLARSQGETGGMVWGSVIFGLAHAPNALAFEGDERREYLLYALPTITLLGSYLSWVYKDADYSLTSSVAIHFWYDLLLSTAVFALDPQNSPLSTSISIPF